MWRVDSVRGQKNENSMKCESCKIKKVETIEIEDSLGNSYKLCNGCIDRLQKRSLRPREYFNLVSTHGHNYYLNDDFYNDLNGIAEQPEEAVDNPEFYPYPEFNEIKHNLELLLDLGFVQYYPEERVLEALNKFNHNIIFELIKNKVKYCNSIRSKALDIISEIRGIKDSNWIKREWKSRREHELYDFGKAMASCLNEKEAFKLLTHEIESKEDRRLHEMINCLVYIKNPKCLDWIEKMTPRIKSVNNSWGHLAASSNFTVKRGIKWLNSGRPLSLISLDAIYYCTSEGERLNQSQWMRELRPVLEDNTDNEILVKALDEYINIDNVPRTRNTIEAIKRYIGKDKNSVL